MGAAIRSIQEQTFVNWELVIFDDGSQDESRKVCLDLAKSDDRIRVFGSTTNRGLASAMNALVAEARADLIAVQEQDDRSAVGRLAAQVSLLDQQPAVGLVSGVARWMDGATEVGLFPGRLARGDHHAQHVSQQHVVQFGAGRRCVADWRKRQRLYHEIGKQAHQNLYRKG